MPSLRNPSIDYSRGWFHITFQVAHNKTLLGAIVGKECVLNDLGREVDANWRKQPQLRPQAKFDEFIVMPNHLHAIVKVDGSRENELSAIVQAFKSYTSNLYLKRKKDGLCPDIGPKLWQGSFYDDLITSYEELQNHRNYIRRNPERWEQDRFGPVTSFSLGNLELLNEPMVAFVASEVPGGGAPGLREPASHEYPAPQRWNASFLPGSREAYSRGPGAPPPGAQGVPPPGAPVLSTFTSPEERFYLRQCLLRGRPFVWVYPGGIPSSLPIAVQTAINENRALLLSPVPTGTGVNKQRAIWCNQYVLRHASSVWHGTIRPGGSLETLLKTLV